MSHLAVAVGVLLLCVACESEKPAEHPIVRMAPFDLDCPKEQLSYTHLDEGTWGVTGCGRRTKYVRICREVGYGMFAHDVCRWVQN
jgi:hypothetical protein